MDVPASITGLTSALPSSKDGPYTFFHDQFASLYAWRNIGTSDYNALQVTYNVRWGANLQGQFNYTLSKSFDEASAAQRIGPYEGTGGTGDDLNGGGIADALHLEHDCILVSPLKRVTMLRTRF